MKTLLLGALLFHGQTLFAQVLPGPPFDFPLVESESSSLVGSSSRSRTPLRIIQPPEPTTDDTSSSTRAQRLFTPPARITDDTSSPTPTPIRFVRPSEADDDESSTARLLRPTTSTRTPAARNSQLGALFATNSRPAASAGASPSGLRVGGGEDGGPRGSGSGSGISGFRGGSGGDRGDRRGGWGDEDKYDGYEAPWGGDGIDVGDPWDFGKGSKNKDPCRDCYYDSDSDCEDWRPERPDEDEEEDGRPRRPGFNIFKRREDSVGSKSVMGGFQGFKWPLRQEDPEEKPASGSSGADDDDDEEEIEVEYPKELGSKSSTKGYKGRRRCPAFCLKKKGKGRRKCPVRPGRPSSSSTTGGSSPTSAEETTTMAPYEPDPTTLITVTVEVDPEITPEVTPQASSGATTTSGEVPPAAESSAASGGSGTLGALCPAQCNPFDPSKNLCDITTSCTTTGGKGYYCACRAGYRFDKNPNDFSEQFRVESQGRVYGGTGEVCGTLCADSSCSEVPLRPQCN